MIDLFYSIDVAVFHFINGTLATPAGDLLWPLITDWDKVFPVRVILIGVWLLLVVKGGSRGRTVAFLLIPVLFFSDKLNSAVIKELIARPRPCHQIDGQPIVQGIHLLVNCGSGKSFPSSHAVNNFAVATLFATYYVRGRWAFFGWAALVALSRTAVGVHYPSDILAGALEGVLIGLAVVHLWGLVQRRYFPDARVGPPDLPAS